MGMSLIDRHRDCVEDEMKKTSERANTANSERERADGNSLWAIFAC